MRIGGAAPEDGGEFPERYPTQAELAAEARWLAERRPGLCRLAPIGRSRAGREIPMLSVGPARARRNVLVVAGPHANEPVGGPTALRLARAVLADPALRDGTAWHLVPCIDPDAAALNEAWTAADPVSLAAMHRHFYRPAFLDQAEWLPVRAPDRLPETRALLRTVDALRPELVCSLHGVDLGGTFVQLTEAIPGFAEPFGKSAAEHDLPVALAAPDARTWADAGPGVFVLPPRGNRLMVPEGVAEPVWTYPARYGGMTAIVEAPMFGADRVSDPAPHPDGRAELARMAALLRERSSAVAQLSAGAVAVNGDGVLLRAVAETVGISRRVAAELEAGAAGGPGYGPEGDGPSTALVADLWLTARRLPLRAMAMLGRIRGMGAATEHADRWVAEYGARSGARWIPVTDQIGHQASSVLAAYTLRCG